jgi:hypothetical protein
MVTDHGVGTILEFHAKKCKWLKVPQICTGKRNEVETPSAIVRYSPETASLLCG